MSSIVKLFIFTLCLYNVYCNKTHDKRGTFEGNFAEYNAELVGWQQDVLHSSGPWQKFAGLYSQVSPAEIAAAISAAKQASIQVLQAQQRVQMAKQTVINQQRLANQKENQASIAAQKAEAAAAVQRQEANAAATSVVLAQQRLAQAKAEVAEQQRIAAEKEAKAALLIQKSANAAAIEIQKSEHTAAKLAALQRSGSTAYKHATANKDSTLSAASAAVAASVSHYPSSGSGSGAAPWAQQAITLGQWHS